METAALHLGTPPWTLGRWSLGQRGERQVGVGGVSAAENSSRVGLARWAWSLFFGGAENKARCTLAAEATVPRAEGLSLGRRGRARRGGGWRGTPASEKACGGRLGWGHRTGSGRGRGGAGGRRAGPAGKAGSRGRSPERASEARPPNTCGGSAA